MSTRNKYGITRNIPEEVKKIVRKRCGFGCVICGNGIFQYDHFNPTFDDATSHDPNGITLLCGYCHDRKTRKQYSIEKIFEANCSPKCLINGYTSFSLDFDSRKPEVVLGTNRFIEPKSIVRLLERDIFWLGSSEDGACLLNFIFFDKFGTEICRIESNEIISNVGNFDIECKGTNISFKDNDSTSLLQISYLPRKEIKIMRLKMNFNGFLVNIDQDSATFNFGGNSARIENSVFRNCEIGINALRNGVQYGVGCRGGMEMGNFKLGPSTQKT